MPSYRTHDTCAREIIFTVKDNILTDLKFIGGCSGNQQALSRLTIGMDIHDIIPKLKGILCRSKTSCPDQLARALEEYIKKNPTT